MSNKKWSKGVVIGIAVIILQFVLIGAGIYAEEKNYGDSLRVMTENDENYSVIEYFEIGKNGKYRRCRPFEPQECTVFRMNRSDSENLADWPLLDMFGNEMETDAAWNEMLWELAKLEKEHYVLYVTVFYTHDGIYYLQAVRNVNLWSPYVIYRYEPGGEGLTYLTTLSDTEVIGLKKGP